MRTAKILAVSLVVGAWLLAGCNKDTGTMVPGPSAQPFDKTCNEMGLRKLSGPEIPDFTIACGDLKDLRQSVQNSIHFMEKPAAQTQYTAAYGRYSTASEYTHARVLASLKAFLQILDSNASPAEMNKAIRETFEVYGSIGYDDKGTVRFSGYCTPIFDARSKQDATFKYPIYKQPPGIVKHADGECEKWKTRGEIENQHVLDGKGLELYYLSDPFEVYIVHVQGSAKLRMENGSLITVGYTASNGQDYVPVAKKLVEDGKITGRLNLQAMIDYFKAHPGDVAKYTQLNPRFVFFAETQGDPRGSINEPVTALRTIAVNKLVFPRAGITMVAAKLPSYNGNVIVDSDKSFFACDQDTGGAFRAAGRADVYMGVGPAAATLAGGTWVDGRLYYLLVKPGLESQYSAPSTPATPAKPAKGGPAPATPPATPPAE